MFDDAADVWGLDPSIVQLNHGSFGACPKAILAEQSRLRARMESQPTHFFTREAPELAERSRCALADFLGAEADDLVLVPNATSGVNAVLRSFPWRSGDEILITDHQYNATRNAAEFAAASRGARVVTAALPFPLASPEIAIEAVLRAVSDRTRLAVLDHVTSPTGLVLPIARLIRELRARDVEVLVDGAHAPGMLPLAIRELSPAYYTGNCHKWMCAPKGVGFLHVRRDLQREVRPSLISHAASLEADDPGRFQAEFGWMGTDDPTARLVLPEVIRYMGSLLPGGWPDLMKRNRSLCLAGRSVVARSLAQPLPCPDEMIGSLAALPLPRSDRYPQSAAASALAPDPLHDDLLGQHGIEVPILACPAHPTRMIRLSAQLYNDVADFEKLAGALRSLL